MADQVDPAVATEEEMDLLKRFMEYAAPQLLGWDYSIVVVADPEEWREEVKSWKRERAGLWFAINVRSRMGMF